MPSPSLILCKMIARSWITWLRSSRGPVQTDFGSTHLAIPLETSLAYIDSCYQDYLTYGQLSEDELAGADILEGGPGDNFGIGLRFLAAGANRYVGVDLFRSVLDPEQQRRIYRAIRARLNPAGQARFDECVDLKEGVRFHEDRLRAIYGHGAGDFASLFPPASFDLVISRAVIEQVDGIENAFAGMDRILKPGGRLLHKIDLTDYGIFTQKGHHPLTMLTFPDFLYRCLAPNSGNLNRQVLADYRRLLAQMGYSAEIYVTSVIGASYPPKELRPHPARLRPEVDFGEIERGLVESIRPRLASRYRAMATEDLIPAGIFISARKPRQV